MLNRYLQSLTRPTLPLSAHRYTVSKDGHIYDEYLKEDVVEQKGYVFLDWIGIPQWWKVDVVVAVTYKNIQLPYWYWDRLDVMRIDTSTRHPKNLIWKFPKGGIRFKTSPEFRYIPGFSSYIINEAGTIINWKKHIELKPYEDASGYLMYGVTPDIGKRTIVGMHRLLGLAFKDYPAVVDEWDVNHIDGIKSNNALSNLEWCTRQGNSTHAFSTGLRKDNQPITILNVNTGEIENYYSASRAAMTYKCTGTTMTNRAKTDGQKVYWPGILVKFSSSVTEFLDLEFAKENIPPEPKTGKNVNSISIEVTINGETKEFPSISSVSREYGISGDILKSGLFGKVKFEYNGYVFKKLSCVKVT